MHLSASPTQLTPSGAVTQEVCSYSGGVHAAVGQLSMPGPVIEREALSRSELALHALTVMTPDGSRRLCEVRLVSMGLPDTATHECMPVTWQEAGHVQAAALP